jgi:hypothetical protein
MVTWSDRRGRGPIYSLITCNRGIYHYIHRLFVIEEYSFIFLGTEEYIHRLYILWWFRWLTEEYKIYSSI